MSERLIAVGDIHGCRAALGCLIEAIDLDPSDRLVTLGDYIDRGPDSAGVLDDLIDLGDRCQVIPLLGNHEEMLLATLANKAPQHWWLGHGGHETLKSYGIQDIDGIPEPHRTWLEMCVPYYEADDYFFTHANYVANESLDRQPAEALRWQSLNEHFPERHESGKIAVVGHTAQRNGEIRDSGHLLCIDTHCYAGGWLTAFDTTSGKIWQASLEGRLREDH